MDQILFVADGAHWIWDSVQLARKMLDMGGVRCKILELIDFYHAVQHLHAFAELKRQWSRRKRKQWISRQKHLLKNGGTTQVIENLQNELVCRNVSPELQSVFPSIAMTPSTVAAIVRIQCMKHS